MLNKLKLKSWSRCIGEDFTKYKEEAAGRQYLTCDQVLREGRVLRELSIEELIELRESTAITSASMLHIIHEYNRRLVEGI